MSWPGWAARLYAGGIPLDDPQLSPITGSFDGFPPVHLNDGTRDLFPPTCADFATSCGRSVATSAIRMATGSR
jgi:hypothetical protein